MLHSLILGKKLAISNFCAKHGASDDALSHVKHRASHIVWRMQVMASEAALSLLAVTLQPFLAAILGILEAVLATIILARWWLPAPMQGL